MHTRREANPIVFETPHIPAKVRDLRHDQIGQEIVWG